MKIRTGDLVVVISGDEKGKKGKVLEVFPKINYVVVEYLNMVKKHVKPNQNNTKGSIVEKPNKIHVSNVALVDPKNNKPSRVGFKIGKDNKKIRVSKKSRSEIK